MEQLPADRPFLLMATAGVSLLVLLRQLLGRTAFGSALVRAAHVAEGAFIALLLAAMISLSFLQILLRNLAQSGWVWVDPLLRHLLLWMGFLAAALATRVNRHISVDAVSRFFSPAALRWLHVAINAFACTVSLFLCNACVKMLRDEMAAGTAGFLDIPVWALQSIMPLATLLMAYRFLGHMWSALRGRVVAAGLQLPGAAP